MMINIINIFTKISPSIIKQLEILVQQKIITTPKPKLYKGEQGEQRKRSQYKNFILSWSDRTLIIWGSVPEYYNSNNLNYLTWISIKHAFEKMEMDLKLGIPEFELKKVSLEANLKVNFIPSRILDHLDIIFSKRSKKRPVIIETEYGDLIMDDKKEELARNKKNPDSILEKEEFPLDSNFVKAELVMKKAHLEEMFNIRSMTVKNLVEKKIYSELVSHWSSLLSEFLDPGQYNFSTQGQLKNYLAGVGLRAIGYNSINDVLGFENDDIHKLNRHRMKKYIRQLKAQWDYSIELCNEIEAVAKYEIKH